jgi:hypothetical protein
VFGAPYKIILNLEPEFAVIEETSLCGINRRRVPYGEMSVDRVSFCCCSSINGWTPGCGCQTQKVNDIAYDLQERVGARGITGQLQKQEIMQATLERLETRMAEMEKKLDLIVQKMDR